MAVITNTILLVRRISDLQRRRAALLERQERIRHSLPEWAAMPLQLVGLTSEEIRGMMSELSEAEQQAGLSSIEDELERLDSQIEEIENMLLTTPAHSLEGIQAVLELAVARLKEQTPSDPEDVFYDYGDARILFFLERVAEDLRSLLTETQRNAS